MGAAPTFEDSAFVWGEGVESRAEDFVEDEVDLAGFGGEGPGSGEGIWDWWRGGERGVKVVFAEEGSEEYAEECAAEVSEVADVGVEAEEGEEDGDEEDTVAEVFGLDAEGEDEEEEGGDGEVGLKGSEGEEDGADSTGGADEAAFGEEEDLEATAGDTAEEEGEEEFAGADPGFDGGAGEPEGEHVDEEVEGVAVEEHVGEELPEVTGGETLAAETEEGDEPSVAAGTDEPLEEEDGDVEDDEGFGGGELGRGVCPHSYKLEEGGGFAKGWGFRSAIRIGVGRGSYSKTTVLLP